MASFTGIFKEIAIDTKLVIPPHKPDMECIIDGTVDVIIDKAEVIDTNLVYPESPDPQDPWPLKKVIAAGVAKIIVKYSALEPTQRVHAAHFDVHFCTLIEWPDGPAQGTPITIKPVVEKIDFIRENERLIFKAILVRLDVYR
ncbi:SPOCS domain-containing protein [Oceanirhabdus sp. W0125-5]|uniref:SPOCS domain-containing protein n=1 Tax=Oceanirhabdus sp. W0125-5 TaxID=2999116 RepID=UPI0022F2ABDA|nr:SPOCS domain-containing protein [Oceanirhabdus sp. W0125-5]WBW96631.1 DUF3794 domain-containing protein [Oceanirhabdus sp. W0125-5]